MQSLFQVIAIWRQRSRLRRSLAMVDRRSLRDAGIDPGFADYEAAQPFWRPPVMLRASARVRPAPAIANDHAPVSADRIRAAGASRI